jgi:hypothetical protein
MSIYEFTKSGQISKNSDLKSWYTEVQDSTFY